MTAYMDCTPTIATDEQAATTVLHKDETMVSAAPLDSIAAVRQRLLTRASHGQSSLLRFKHESGSKGSGRSRLRLLAVKPDALYQRLIEKAGEYQFLAVPEPKPKELLDAGYLTDDPVRGHTPVRELPHAREWAAYLGLPTTYLLPAVDSIPDAGKPEVLQVLHFPTELEAILRNLRAKAETTLEETGAQALYLAIGFLVWFESPDSNIEHRAPLYLVPVSLRKDKYPDPITSTYRYTLTWSGEELRPNLALRERLRMDFALALPELDTDTAPETYFDAVLELIGLHQPRWRIERMATLAPLSLGKLLMYLDLDPQIWPDAGLSLTSHPILKRFFTAAPVCEDPVPVLAEHDTDALPETHTLYPLIEDADSSQHSALIDALDGENLVIQGPPGTGKSQTITNIIAAALARGRTVLFVAEKMAALQVVKHRLDRAGFGDFCLELHSNKVQKRAVLDSLASRLAIDSHLAAAPTIDLAFSQCMARHEQRRTELTDYVRFMNKPWRGTGLTPHRILNEAARHQLELNVAATDVHPNDCDGERFSPAFEHQCLESIQHYAHAHEQVCKQLGDYPIAMHPWHGLTSSTLEFFDAPMVLAALNDWQTSLSAVQSAHHELLASVAPAVAGMAAPPTLGTLTTLVEDLNVIPEPAGHEIFALLPALTGDTLSDAESALVHYRSIHDRQASLGTRLSAGLLAAPEHHTRVQAATTALRRLGIVDDMRLGDVAKIVLRLAGLEARFTRLASFSQELRPHLDPAAVAVLDDSLRGLQALHGMLELAKALPEPLVAERNRCFDNDTLDAVLRKLTKNLAILHTARSTLAKTFRLDVLPAAAELSRIWEILRESGMFGWLNASVRGARQRLRELAIDPGISRRQLESALPDLVDFTRKQEALLATAAYSTALGARFEGLDTEIDALNQLRTWHCAVRNRFGIGFGTHVVLGDTLLDLDTPLFRTIQARAEQDMFETGTQAFHELDALRTLLRANDPLNNPDTALTGAHGEIARVRRELEQALAICQQALHGDDAELAELDNWMRELQMLRTERATWSQALQQPTIAALASEFGLSISVHAGSPVAEVQARNMLDFASRIERGLRSPWLQTALRAATTLDEYTHIAATGSKLRSVWPSQNSAREHFERIAELNSQQWGADPADVLEKLLERNARAINHRDWLPHWFDFTRFRSRMQILGLGPLLGVLDLGAISADQLLSAFRLGVTDLLARELYRRSDFRKLMRSGLELNAIRDDYREQDKSLKNLQSRRIIEALARKPVPAGIGGGAVSNYTDLALIRHEIGKKQKHVPIRQLIRRAGLALQALKPCFMMSPQSIAQYLIPGQHTFDLLIMDEASQIRPEEAVGAIARARQVIVVGDRQQLPPTSFFDRFGGESEEDETPVLAGAESILEAAAPIFRSRMLRWHYRSQHEALIAFSNARFYDHQLIIFPSPHAQTADYGIRLTRVPNGVFAGGRNETEALAIARAAAEHLLNRPDESLGLVAMNAEQRDLIERALEELGKNDPMLLNRLEFNRTVSEPLFVKNLENVQGDERDVIMISFTYGPSSVGGRVAQRFGPINSAAGHRRLNVLFTRAKRRMHLFASFGAEDVLVSETSSHGVRALRDFLTYAATGILSTSPQSNSREPDSDFEIAVRDLLAEAGFECVPQLGVSGFYLDLAVRDPAHPGRYLMGIECDGASYHSAKSARDRDRLRQSILEQLGWRIRRVWSTDFFKAPRPTLAGILSELQTLALAARAEAEAEATLYARVPFAPTLYTEPTAAMPESEASAAEEIRTEEDTSGVRECLRDRLLRFEREVIRPALPDTPPAQRLLAPAMLDALLKELPTTSFEFLDLMPEFLRTQVAAPEGYYLPSVLALIGDHVDAGD